jgi:hypothetical protein
LVCYERAPSPVHAGTKAAFYLFSSVPEILVCLLYILPNLNEWYDIPMARQKMKDDKAMKKGTYQGPAYGENGQYADHATVVGEGGYEMKNQVGGKYQPQTYQA